VCNLTAFRVLLIGGEQADHIVPVSGGGGECDLSNYQTLCTGEQNLSNKKDSDKVVSLI
jgi:5-methylcytosine-specific restriction endonuclease McrA